MADAHAGELESRYTQVRSCVGVSIIKSEFITVTTELALRVITVAEINTSFTPG